MFRPDSLRRLKDATAQAVERTDVFTCIAILLITVFGAVGGYCAVKQIPEPPMLASVAKWIEMLMVALAMQWQKRA